MDHVMALYVFVIRENKIKEIKKFPTPIIESLEKQYNIDANNILTARQIKFILLSRGFFTKSPRKKVATPKLQTKILILKRKSLLPLNDGKNMMEKTLVPVIRNIKK